MIRKGGPCKRKDMLRTHVRLCHVAELEQLVRSACSTLSVGLKCLNTHCSLYSLRYQDCIKPAAAARLDLPF